MLLYSVYYIVWNLKDKSIMTSNFICIQDLKIEEDRKKRKNQRVYKYLNQFCCLLRLFDLPNDANILGFIDDVYFNEQYKIDGVCVRVSKEGKISFKTFLQYLQSVYKCLKYFGCFHKVFGSDFESIVAFFEMKCHELVQKEKDGELIFASKIKENKENERNEEDEGMSDDMMSEEGNEEIKNDKTIEVQNHHIKDNNAIIKSMEKSDENDTKDKRDMSKNNILDKGDPQDCIVTENNKNNEAKLSNVKEMNEVKYITLREDEFEQQKVEFANEVCKGRLNCMRHDVKIMHDEFSSYVDDALEELQKSENMESAKIIGRLVANMSGKIRKCSNILFKM